MAAAEDPIVTLLKEVAAKKGVTIRGLDSAKRDNIDLNGQSDSIEVFENGEKVGGIGYSFLMANVNGITTRLGAVTKEVKCISINSLNVTKTGNGLGSLLIACALWVGLANDRKYSILDDMSAKYAELEDNIYSYFGFTHKDLIEIIDGKLKDGIMPEKQLELPNERQMLRNFEAMFKKKGGKKRYSNKVGKKSKGINAGFKKGMVCKSRKAKRSF